MEQNLFNDEMIVDREDETNNMSTKNNKEKANTKNLTYASNRSYIACVSSLRTVIKNVTYGNVCRILFRPTHAASLAVARILFGLLMLCDIPDERAGSYFDSRWGDPRDCHFPLFPHIQILPLPWMGLLYGIMWMGALGITLGFQFSKSCLAFIIPYWYLLLLDKSFWNNHSYLFGLVAILFLSSSANDYWSLDAWNKSEKKNFVPNWNYFILKFQFFLLYFYAGMKKTDMEWLDGYSMTNLGTHWVFMPFRILLTSEQVDYLIVHWSGFLLDVSVGFFLWVPKTRPIAMIFCSMFHLMNTRLFSIGMFPYVCLVTMPLFCAPDWPLKLLRVFTTRSIDINLDEEVRRAKAEPFSKRHHKTISLLGVYCFLQLFLPYSHFITKGYNNWTNGMYGYSWDMMVHSWDTTLVVVRVVDNESGQEHFLDPEAWTQNDRWNKHADMCVQYAQCLKRNLVLDHKETYGENDAKDHISGNISIYFDVWCSLNGRFQQRMYNPNYDLLKARWSPFKPVEWLLPLLIEYSGLRTKMKEITDHVHSWSNYSDVLFIADFPGFRLDNFISSELVNTTLTVIEGDLYVEQEHFSKAPNIGYRLQKGGSMRIHSGIFHTVHTLGTRPSCFMYTFTNSTKESTQEVVNHKYAPHSPVPMLEDSKDRIEHFMRMFGLIADSIINILYGVPMIAQKRM